MFEVGKNVYFRDEEDGLRGKIGTIMKMSFVDDVMVVMEVRTPDGKYRRITKVNPMAQCMGLLEKPCLTKSMN